MSDDGEQSGIDQALQGSKPEKTEAAQSEDLQAVYAITLREAQKAPVALSLVQLLAVGAFDGPRPQQPNERAPLLPKPYRQAGGSVLLLGTSLCIENNVNDVRVVSRRPCVPQSGECSVAVLDTSCGVEMDNALISSIRSWRKSSWCVL